MTVSAGIAAAMAAGLSGTGVTVCTGAAASVGDGVAGVNPKAALILDCVRPDAAAAALANDTSVGEGVASIGGGCMATAGVIVAMLAATSAGEASAVGAVGGVVGRGAGAGAESGLAGAGTSARAGAGVFEGEDGQHARKLPAVQAMLPEPVVQMEVGS